MKMIRYPDFKYAIKEADTLMRDSSHVVHTRKWQGVDISKRPEAAMHEVLNVAFEVPMPSDSLAYYRNQIKPNLPWADDHLLERLCGEPLNPGKEWANWPYANSANGFRDDNGQFNHNYMERYWPRYAGMSDHGELKETVYDPNSPLHDPKAGQNFGIRYRYGDLNDVVEQLHREPDTRQAYFPIFFPEDTGVANPDRKPCTLGHLFRQHDGVFDMTYYIRSCDFVRHFRDDLYLSVGLHLWVLGQLRRLDAKTWKTIKPGIFRIDIGSLHMFRNDFIQLYGAPQ